MITFDAATGSTYITATSITISHTMGSGSFGALFVTAIAGTSLTGVTYDGVAMSLVTSDGVTSLWKLAAPHPGTHNLVITQTSSNYIGGYVSSYFGVEQGSGMINASPHGVSTVPYTLGLTTTVDKCWIVAGGNTGSTISITSGGILRAQDTHTNAAIFDSNGNITPAGSASMTLTSSGGNMTIVMAAIAPATTGTTNYLKERPRQRINLVPYSL